MTKINKDMVKYQLWHVYNNVKMEHLLIQYLNYVNNLVMVNIHTKIDYLKYVLKQYNNLNLLITIPITVEHYPYHHL